MVSSSVMQKMSCKENRGSPVWKNEANKSVLIGLYPHGINCEPFLPIRILRIKPFMPWINKVLTLDTFKEARMIDKKVLL